MCTEPASRQNGQRGISLVELIIFIVIVSVGLAGILSVFNITSGKSADPMPVKQALAIAEALLEEVQLSAFTWCDPDDANVLTAVSAAGCATLAEGSGSEAGDTRPYDNVNDYDTFSMTPITDIAGTAIAGLGAYSASVSVATADLNTITAASGAALLITVTVTGPGGTSIAMSGYRTRYAPNSVP